ncbi:unnamed protein product [Onchocerca flexuosa]|uniref:DUF4422 domain-containing protein n=1 Tax=Onchocerca flexuosa TaxID=387005 RepID=A0A183HBW8_9BILA|nr:unnamed protein product [Onchocerca flexuosa]
MYTMIDIKVYNGLQQLRYKPGAESRFFIICNLCIIILSITFVEVL